MNISYTSDGMEALLYTCDGDLRQAINNLQATYSGFDSITSENVMKVCDQPHPVILEKILDHCVKCEVKESYDEISALYNEGYSCNDIIGTFFKVIKNSKNISEEQKLKFVKEIGIVHMRAIEGVTSLLQLYGLCSRLCSINMTE